MEIFGQEKVGFTAAILYPNHGDNPMGPPGEFGTREVAQRSEDITR